MRGNDVPEQHVLLELELGQDAMGDGGRRFRRPQAGELPLGRERDPGDACAPVPGRLADEEDRRGRLSLQVVGEPRAQEPRTWAFRVLVEGRSDVRGRDLLDECVVG
jgi:hypothetical protein